MGKIENESADYIPQVIRIVVVNIKKIGHDSVSKGVVLRSIVVTAVMLKLNGERHFIRPDGNGP